MVKVILKQKRCTQHNRSDSHTKKKKRHGENEQMTLYQGSLLSEYQLYAANRADMCCISATNDTFSHCVLGL